MSRRILVLGAGPAGLSAAHHLGPATPVYEEHEQVGGHCRSKTVHGFVFDEGAHVFFGTDEISRKLVLEPLAADLVPHRSDVWNDYGAGRFGRYPVQANLHALPPEEAATCLLGFIEAQRKDERVADNYEQWCRFSFGDAMAERFMLRYASKVWTMPASALNTEWLGSSVGGRILRPSLEQVVRGALDPHPHDLNYYSDFFYPRHGGFQAIVEPVRAGLEAVRLSCGARWIHSRRRVVELADGSTTTYDALVSSIPLPTLVALTTDAPAEVREAADRLMWTSVRCVNFGVRRANLGPGHWVYFYDEHVPFFRASFPHKFAPGNAPGGCGSISCEIAYSRRRPLGPGDPIADCHAALVAEGILASTDEILVQDVTDAPYAYVVYDAERRPSLATIHAWMEAQRIVPCGRFGEWGYHWSFDALESGRRAAERARAIA